MIEKVGSDTAIGHIVAMCGIWGAVPPHPDSPRRSTHSWPVSATAAPTPRAASGTAAESSPRTGSSIIDLVTGDPPITNEDGTIGAVLNGEIYNFGALRERAARATGTRSRAAATPRCWPTSPRTTTRSSLARRLDGMFAFAVWDSRRERLVLGRDRLGKKPLYYWSGPDTFVFASEIKGVLAHPGGPV